MKGAIFTVILFVCILFPACKNKQAGVNTESIATNAYASSLSPRYAEGFKVTCRPDSVKLIEIKEPANENAPIHYIALIPKGKQVTDIPEEYEIIHTPVERVICMTTPQLAGFSMMNEYDKVVGTSNTRRIQDKEWLTRLNDGRVRKIGIEGNFDTEIVLAAEPDIILVSPNRRGGYEVLAETGIPIIPYWAFKETSPLGLSEWIKLVGMLIGKEKTANQLFFDMEKEYNRLKDMVNKVKKKPTIFSGELRAGNWYVPGGQSFYAKLFKDAGADYFLKDDLHTGGILLDFETVYSKANDIEYWRVMNAYKGTFTYKAFKMEDPRYTDFRAFRDKKVIYCNLEYIPLYENLPSSPHILLLDMIKAFHPELATNHIPVYYKLLKE